MKTRTVILIAMAACLLLGSVAFGQNYSRISPPAQGRALAQSNEPAPEQYVVAQGVASGGGYRLTSIAWQVSGASRGGEYRLQGPASPGVTIDQCCCTYLPCVKKN